MGAKGGLFRQHYGQSIEGGKGPSGEKRKEFESKNDWGCGKMGGFD